MIIESFFVPFRLPGQNEIIAAAKSKRRKGTAYDMDKRKITAQIASICSGMDKMERVRVQFEWVEPNKRRDPDNIMAGAKYILDALVKAGVIENDGWKQIAGFSHDFFVGEPVGVRVTLEEVEK